MTHTAQILPRQTAAAVSEPLPVPFPLQVVSNGKMKDGCLQIKTLRTLSDIEAAKKAWRRLEDEAARSFHLFQSYDWCSSWIRNYAQGNDCYSIHVVTVWRGSDMVCLWPMMTTCVGPLCILRWLSDPYGQYGDALIHPDVDRDKTLGLVWRELCAIPGVDAIRLRHVREDANTCSFLKKNAINGGPYDSAPFLDMEKFPDEAAYEARYSRQQRRRRKRIAKGLSAIGEISFGATSAKTGLDDAITRAIDEKRHWLKERGLISKPVMSEEINRFARSLFADSESLQPVMSVLKAGSREISWEIGLRYKGRHCGFITAHDHTLTDKSPARLHMDQSQRLAIRDGCRIFDLMVPGDPHKKTWSSDTVRTSDFHQPLKLRGRIFAFVYLNLLRPVARKLYHDSPSKIRRRLMNLIGR